MGIVYVLSNPAFDNYVKVGQTTDLEQRMKQLDTTGVPLPFRCVFAVEVDESEVVERLVHQAFADFRVRTTREFFEIDAQRVIAALKIANGNDVTPKGDIAEDEESIAALDRIVAKSEKRKNSNFLDADINPGDILTYTKNPSITATVLGNKKIKFRDNETSVSKAALTLLHEEGYKWKGVNGWDLWMKGDETLTERIKRLAAETEETDD